MSSKNGAKKKKSKARVGYEAARILALAVFLACAGIIGDKIYGYLHADETEIKWKQVEKIEYIGVTPEPPQRTAPPYPEVTPERITYPQIVTMDELERLEQYEDFVCWLYIDGSDISNYVAQAEDNEFYLRKNLAHETVQTGSLFLDFRNDKEMSSRHNIIYGHNQKNGTMFSDLRAFGDPDYFRAHPLIYTYTTKGVRIWKVFSAYETNTDDYYIETWFESGSSYFDFIRTLQDKYFTATDIVLKSSDIVLTLSTCHKYSDPNGRFVVHAIQVGEAPLS